MPDVYMCHELEEYAREYPEGSGVCDHCGGSLEENHTNLNYVADQMRDGGL